MARERRLSSWHVLLLLLGAAALANGVWRMLDDTHGVGHTDGTAHLVLARVREHEEAAALRHQGASSYRAQRAAAASALREDIGEVDDTSSSKLDEKQAAAAHDADAHGSGTLATSSSVSSAARRRELRPEQREPREQQSTAQAHRVTTHGRHAGHRAHGGGHGSSSSSSGSSGRRAGPPPYARTAPVPRMRDNGGGVRVGGGVEGDEGGEEGEGALAEFKESGTRTLGTRLQRDAFSAVMASQGLRTRAGLDKALSDVSEFLRTVPSDGYFRGEHDFDVGRPAEDDDSACSGLCGHRGMCRRNKCRCTAAYSGMRCQEPRELPHQLNAEFDGATVLNRHAVGRMRHAGGYKFTYTANPTKAAQERHSFVLPVTTEILYALPLDDPFASVKYERCAVVGNSGILALYRLGEHIDSHDMVIRFNLAPTEGYGDIVGRKTTFRLVNSQHVGFHEANESVIQQMQSEVGVQLFLKARADHPEHKIFAFAPEFSTYVSSNIDTLPTGGYFGVWLALQQCAQVNVFGFHFRHGFGVDHHYFNAETPLAGESAIHDYTAEFVMIRALAQARVLTLAVPCAVGCEEESGVHNDEVAAGGMCQCGNPLPVAQPGFCRPPQTFACFLPCPGGASQCAGGLHLPIGEEPTEPVDGVGGDCPEQVLSQHRIEGEPDSWMGCAVVESAGVGDEKTR